MDEAEQREYIHDKGWIRTKVIFEVVGNPQKHVEESLQSYMENIKTDSQVKVLDEYSEPAEEVEDGLFSMFTEAECLVDGLNKLTWICFNFSPASVEIMEPANFEYHASDLQNWINDFLAKLHEVSQMSQQVQSQNKLLINNMNRLIKNSIVLCIDHGIDTPKGIEERIGIEYDQLKPFFEALIKEGKLELHDEQYERVDE
jgi:hypothetical protein